jgi:hypothetical protein
LRPAAQFFVARNALIDKEPAPFKLLLEPVIGIALDVLLLALDPIDLLVFGIPTQTTVAISVRH